MPNAAVVDLHSVRERRQERVRRAMEPWVTEADVARHLKVSVRTLRRWRTEPRYFRGGRPVPFRQLWGPGSAVSYRIADVEDWLEREAGR